jgi:hypothetical protein
VFFFFFARVLFAKNTTTTIPPTKLSPRLSSLAKPWAYSYQAVHAAVPASGHGHHRIQRPQHAQSGLSSFQMFIALIGFCFPLQCLLYRYIAR